MGTQNSFGMRALLIPVAILMMVAYGAASPTPSTWENQLATGKSAYDVYYYKYNELALRPRIARRSLALAPAPPQPLQQRLPQPLQPRRLRELCTTLRKQPQCLALQFQTTRAIRKQPTSWECARLWAF